MDIHERNEAKYHAILDDSEEEIGEDEGRFEKVAQLDSEEEKEPKIVPPGNSKWSKFASREEPIKKNYRVNEPFFPVEDVEVRKKDSMGNKPPAATFLSSSKSYGSSLCVGPNISSYSNYYQPTPAPLPKLIDLHKKPSSSRTNFRPSITAEPPQKKMKPTDQYLDDDFELSHLFN